MNDLVVFGEDWGAHPSSTQHLVKRLGRDRRVVWANSLGLRRPRLAPHDLRRAASKLGRMIARPRAHAEHAADAGCWRPTRCVDPLVVPFPGNRLARLANRALVPSRVRKAMASAGITRPILWASLPTAVDAVGRLGERAVVYYCGDDFGALAGVDHVPVLALEEELVARADLVIAASDVLAARFPRGKTHVVRHGVDLSLFASPAPRAEDLPDGLTAGFYGTLADWVDVELIAAAARQLPDWTMVVIGPITTDACALQRLPNVRLLGPRPHAQLARYAQHWTASLLPFRDVPQIHACNPLKLREYLAAGAPIVATDFPALDGYRDLVRVAPTHGAFVAAIAATAAIGGARRAVLARLQRERVKEESWEERARDVAALIDAL
ncbi:MAG: glycosyltransferase [Alphaproteobacteria bacterium]|nr:glycosyltransferase [Alphaproteobacteria bacterium]